MRIPIQDLASEPFAPYGQIITIPERSADASGPGWQWWGELVTMDGGDHPYAIGCLKLTPADLRFDWAERHMHTDELIVPITGNCLVYVAPAEFPEEPDRLPEMSHFAVFRVPVGQAVLLKSGVWHGAPLAETSQTSALVILQKDAGKVDCHIQRFHQQPVDIG